MPLCYFLSMHRLRLKVLLPKQIPPLPEPVCEMALTTIYP